MDVIKRLQHTIRAKDINDGTYLAAKADSGQVFLGIVLTTENGKRFVRHTVNVYTDSFSTLESSSEPLSDYILLNEVK